VRSEIAKNVDRNICGALAFFYAPDVVLRDIGKLSKAQLREADLKPGHPQILCQCVMQCNRRRRRGLSDTLRGHARLKVHHVCGLSIAYHPASSQWLRTPSDVAKLQASRDFRPARKLSCGHESEQPSSLMVQ
jgi:hypothetical protein